MPRGGYVGGGLGLGGLEKKMAKVTITGLRGAPDRAQKRVRFNDDRLEETLKPKLGCIELPSSYPLDLTGGAVGRAAGMATSTADPGMNPITGSAMNVFNAFATPHSTPHSSASTGLSAPMAATTAPDTALSVTLSVMGSGAAARMGEVAGAGRVDVSLVQRALQGAAVLSHPQSDAAVSEAVPGGGMTSVTFGAQRQV